MADILFENVSIFDTSSGRFLPDMNVKVCGARIGEISAGLKPREGDIVIDCTGTYMLPGLIDAHVHLVWNGISSNPMSDTIRDGNYLCLLKAVESSMRSLKAGVTTVRDLGSCDDVSIPLARSIREGMFPGTNIIPAGGAIQGSYGHCPMIGSIANTESELISRIKQLKGYHVEMQTPPVHWIKIMASGGAAGSEDVGPCMYSSSELNTIVSEAHRLNMKVAAHALSRESITECIRAGVDTIEHGGALNRELLIEMRNKGLTWVPTLAVYKELSESRGIVSDLTADKAVIVTAQQRRAFQDALELGVSVILGSDAGSPNFGAHPSVFKEMNAMRDYGMSPADIIKSATIVSAEILGISKERGSIETGKLADLLLLDQNPLETLKAFTNHLAAVYKEGVLVNEHGIGIF